MANSIVVKKGLNIKIDGKAFENVSKVKPSSVFEVYPDVFHGVIPKMLVKGGESIQAGSPLFYNKNFEGMNFVSPVSGKVREVVRGERRKVMSIVIDADSEIDYLKFDVKNADKLDKDTIKNLLLQSGLWVYIKQRPYDVIADPMLSPKAVFISGFDSSPLAPDYEFVMKNQMKDFQAGINIISKLTSSKIHIGIPSEDSIFKGVSGVQTTVFKGPHPAGNVGVHINKIDPINKGETVWTINPQDVAIIGRFFEKGVVDLTKIIALTGPEVEKPHYFETVSGNNIADIVKGNLKNVSYPLRYISGNVLTGLKISEKGYLTPYASQVTVIDEGSQTHEMFGWAMPRLNKFSASNLFFTKLLPRKKFKWDARMLGGPRSIIMSGEWERVFPFDILPEQLIKTMMAGNIERMENLGAYEIAPEDFALCEFVDTSKLPLQDIVRKALDELRSEMI
ncbi:MAG: Na(+)-translocating NADH-quinone reductase subunit A [Porphyromonadaceae bacterium]|nr:Na(+)-translocating NADH-quinone reductase subunit A [Porphyromonadaceae bacterium]